MWGLGSLLLENALGRHAVAVKECGLGENPALGENPQLSVRDQDRKVHRGIREDFNAKNSFGQV